MKFNINKWVKVKVTDFGKKILEDQHNELMEMLPEDSRRPFELKVDNEGWTEIQMWELMNRIGPYCHMGIENAIETEIDFVV